MALGGGRGYVHIVGNLGYFFIASNLGISPPA